MGRSNGYKGLRAQAGLQIGHRPTTSQLPHALTQQHPVLRIYLYTKSHVRQERKQAVGFQLRVGTGLLHRHGGEEPTRLNLQERGQPTIDETAARQKYYGLRFGTGEFGLRRQCGGRRQHARGSPQRQGQAQRMPAARGHGRSLPARDQNGAMGDFEGRSYAKHCAGPSVPPLVVGR